MKIFDLPRGMLLRAERVLSLNAKRQDRRDDSEHHIKGELLAETSNFLRNKLYMEEEFPDTPVDCEVIVYSMEAYVFTRKELIAYVTKVLEENRYNI